MSNGTILIADDDGAIRTVLDKALGRAGYKVQCTGNTATLWRWIGDGQGDLIITDIIMPDESGLELLTRIRKLRPNIPVIVMSAQSTILTAIQAAERGAHDYLAKPFDLNVLVKVVKRALASKYEYNQQSISSTNVGDALPLIGRSPAMQEIYRILARLMQTNLTVMISGESGTGKELVARALHEYGKRRNGPFVPINMAAIPRDLVESELFGYEKGAFTGATIRNPGHFEYAEGGTLFLDEIGDMPPEVQTRLLRVLQQGEYNTVGGRVAIRSNVRIIAASNQDLRQLIEQGLFREDLYYRLNVVPIHMPPLRERALDIPDLTRHFLIKVEESGLPKKQLTQPAFEKLRSYDWPGNVRELENLIQRIAVLYPEDVIDLDTIEEELKGMLVKNTTALTALNLANNSIGTSVESHILRYFEAHEGNLPPIGLYDRVIREVERPLIKISLKATDGNQIRAAQLLGINRNTLRKKIKELSIQVGRDIK